MSLIISADIIKEELPNYSPDKAELFHTQSAKQADKIFVKEIKTRKFSTVILLNGGTASGKTEFLSSHLKYVDAIIVDGTLSTELGAKNKLRQIEKARKIPVIYTVLPDDLRRAFLAFLHRDRRFSNEHFYRTHAGSRKTLLWLVSNYNKLEVHIIKSFYTKKNTLQFSELRFSTRNQLVSYVARIQIDEHDIINTVKGDNTLL